MSVARTCRELSPLSSLLRYSSSPRAPGNETFAYETCSSALPCKYHAEIHGRQPQCLCIGSDFTVEPVIVRGRFILMAKYEFHRGDEDLSYSTFMQTIILFCPCHLTNNFIDLDDPFFKLVRSAFRRSNDTSDFCQDAYSCDRCPSDYSILIRDKKLVITVWRDLDTRVTPEDPYWSSQTRDDENNYAKGDEFPYEHGSIRRMFYSSEAY